VIVSLLCILIEGETGVCGARCTGSGLDVVGGVARADGEMEYEEHQGCWDKALHC